MPLRDHFHPPVNALVDWTGVHAGWPMMMILRLNPTLPEGYWAEPRVQLGVDFEVDVGALDRNGDDPMAPTEGGTTTAVLAAPRPTLTVETDLPEEDEFEVRVYEPGRRLVAAVELVSPRNKDRPDSRRAFVEKCAALLRKGVCVTVVDLVTTRRFNLYADLLDRIGESDPLMGADPPPLYAVTCRLRRERRRSWLDTWAHVLAVGQPLPTLPLWLADDQPVNLELELSYEDTYRALRLPPPD